MEAVNKFCRTLEKDDFDRIPRTIQKLFYDLSIYCDQHGRRGDEKVCQYVLQYYEVLNLSLGVRDRIDMTKAIGMHADRFIPDKMKGILKVRTIQNIVNKLKVYPDAVYFYDDIPEIVSTVAKSGVNAVLVKGGIEPEQLEKLVRKKEYDSSSVKVVLLDFDKTLTVHKIKKQNFSKDTNYIVENFMGGWDRLDKVFRCLKRLESVGVQVGIITLNVKYRILPLLEEIGWILDLKR